MNNRRRSHRGNSPSGRNNVPDFFQGFFNLLRSLNDSNDSDDSQGQTTSNGGVLQSPFQGLVLNKQSQRRQNSSNQGSVRQKKTTYERETPPQSRNFTERVQIGNTVVTLQSGNLAEQEVDVIVNSVAMDLDLTKGAGSSSILELGGHKIQEECWEKYPSGISVDDVVVTEGGNLRCWNIYHITIPPWRDNNEGVIKSALSNCFAFAEASDVTSIAIPPLGYGLYLNYPLNVIAKTMISAIVDRKKSQDSQNCKSIFIICHRTQHSVYKALKKEIQQLKDDMAGNSVQICMDLYNEDLKSPYYWTQYDHSKSLRSWNCHLLSERCWEQVPVSKDEFAAIRNTVQNTWMSELVGLGKDAKGLKRLGYTNVEVTEIERIENPLLAKKYGQTRAAMFHKVGMLGKTFQQLENMPYTKRGHILTTSHSGEVLSRDMHPMVNEHYLFHGTTTERIDVIAAQGFDSRLTQNAMFGAGVYAAESSTKADQYSDHKDQRDNDTPKKIILARILLGEMFVTNEERSFQRPPCKTCKEDTCCNTSHNLQGNGFFDSVVVDGKWNFREFVVYDSSQCYPEYIITYKRF